ncbi:CRISPR-associated endonuclease Cas1 [Desulfitibacter alkalitolerans]|uniref:CRISPR-associated endonuclease Cas1 n=1 Tax=Desulfitibacter alkalitolerans TaxID=264641 RepID=UPI000486EDA8|nr:CRISPR-associated endonuclease Cas1 [Desulfitibacter alkalitolerans]
MDLVISDYGTFLGKKSQRLTVKQNGKVVNEVPFFELQQLIIEGKGITFSSDLLQECMEHGINISFLSHTGTPYANLTSSYLNGSVITRREQLMSYKDKRGVKLVKLFVEGKLKNQRNVIKYFSKYRKVSDTYLFNELQLIAEKIEKLVEELKGISGNNIDEIRGNILSLEGRAGNLYWQGVAKILGPEIDFPGREHRPANHPVNAALNYGYAILSTRIEKCLLLAGLEIFGGFLHVDRPGKKSLVYDFIEEFRQPVVDRVVIALVNKGTKLELEDGYLTNESKKLVGDKVLEKLQQKEMYQGKKYTMETIMQRQARRIATFLREEANYKPFVCGW